MGGCCCCSSKGTELNTTTAYYYYPRASEEHVPLSSDHGGASVLSTGLLVDTNLDTSIPDTYRPPPVPMPYDVVLGRPQTPPVAQEICTNKTDAAVLTTNSDSVQESAAGDTLEISAKCEALKEPGCKTQINFEFDSVKGEVELSKSVEPVISASEEEDCPVCLEGDVLTATPFNIQMNMTQRIQKSPQCVSMIFTLHAFLSGWREVTLVLYVIRK
ncbi:probable E3 ubiquitin-protein ligase RHB1A isoform X1 [Juglans microcarpa x Juglans regia]|uniref:probable E3 ubiquitin-protein ligase RHB1A isoform X1 n=1 Tax=Juglans microcarpa x Juglans regia TaxID=2249226 RepID=UPI001B7EB128|nr:probable E3 ubiquitin-protein ligase RHB1A isoform X1 [Juglans microcarpa x Juglans regia]XP_040990392.1 probable E3 ubiquitin-protein ligase RHB1A isoform X1 [Juglans microcarpa x Juglans regia]